MKRILLLGAGFSRNWGGWLSSEVSDALLGRVGDRQWLSEMLRTMNNFEEVLAARRGSAQTEGIDQQIEDVRLLESAILETFGEMNLAFARRKDFEFSRDAKHSVRHFLAAFDAIFTLNLDLLLEFQYADPHRRLIYPRRWTGHYFPGAVPSIQWEDASGNEARVGLTVTVTSPVEKHADCQPIFKLHGSVHWRAQNGGPVIVMGTGKEETINGSSILREYREQFREYLCAPDTQIMVIGYSFSDEHINNLLLEGAGHGLKMFLVNPAGRGSFNGPSGTPVLRAEKLRNMVIGMSTRPLSTTFGDDEDPSFAQFRRFLGVV